MPIAELLVHLASVVTAVAGVGVQPQDPAPPPTESASSVRTIDSAEALMDATKAVSDALDRVSFEIRYTKLFAIAGDIQQRAGRAIVETDTRTPDQIAADPGAPPRRAFGLRFETLRTGDRVDQELRELVFDGEWLVETIPAERLVIRRQLAPPDQPIDAFRLGEGPFVVLVGQDRADVARRFDARMPSDPTEGLAAWPSLAQRVGDTYQLHLTVRPELADIEQLQEVRLWYDRATLLPVLGVQIEASGDETVVELIGVATDEAVAPADRALIDTTPPAGPGWDIQTHPYREPDRNARR